MVSVCCSVEALQNKTSELVVARYNERLEWLKDVDEKAQEDQGYKLLSEVNKITIYNKGDNEDFFRPTGSRVVQLTNCGREGHSYLYHIVQHYDDLCDVTIFLPGSSLETKRDKVMSMLSQIDAHNEAVITFIRRDLTRFQKNNKIKYFI